MTEACQNTESRPSAPDGPQPARVVLHLIPEASWSTLAADDAVRNPSLETEGFLHCTDDAGTLLHVANAFYRDAAGPFVVLHVDVERLSSRCVWEALAHLAATDSPQLASLGPHIYGPIDRTAIVCVQSIDRDSTGAFTGYGPLRSSI